MKVLVTGGAGFIGSAVIRHLLQDSDARVVNIDKLTYAANLEALEAFDRSEGYRFEQVDICEAAKIQGVFQEHKPDAVIHLAAESHVDRSIDGPAAFVSTNIVGTYALLEAAIRYRATLDSARQESFRFLHVSTDEVFGSLGDSGRFTEETAYRPNSPYSASKAASDHLARAWHRTFGLPVVVTNCGNNYGPYQFPEKFIPTVIVKALAGEAIPVYGDGGNVRDWLFVEDHARALWQVLQRGQPGETYNIGGRCEKTNIEVIRHICGLLDELAPDPSARPHDRLVTFVADRPGHDRRYAMDTTKIETRIGWRAEESFESGLRRTVAWYLANRAWSDKIVASRYRGERLGLGVRGDRPDFGQGTGVAALGEGLTS